MGKPEPRLDGRLKVTGEARYGSDFVVSNPAYAFLVTSPIAKGRIESMDLRTAKAVPGLLEIFNYENTGELKDIKYAKGGGGPTSSIQGFGPLIQYGGQIVALVVADTGVGIPSEDQARVFEKFERGNPQARQSGAGLGLSLVKRFIEPHRGRVELVSEANKVTTIALYLPADPAASENNPGQPSWAIRAS